MNKHIGIAGRRARDLVQGRIEVGRPVSIRDNVRDDPLPLVQRAVSEQPAVDTAEHLVSSAMNDLPAEAVERVASAPSAKDVAERVYRLFCQDLRRYRERRGNFMQ